eukprot:1392899-Amorphochlora_amoeboformis.AAC.1
MLQEGEFKGIVDGIGESGPCIPSNVEDIKRRCQIAGGMYRHIAVEEKFKLVEESQDSFWTVEGCHSLLRNVSSLTLRFSQCTF